LIEALIAALAGLLIGSFLNVCIYRMPRDLSVVSPRSFCPSCEARIAWFDNIPVVSYVLLRGRCRHCGQAISIRYPVVEILTAAVFFCSIWFLGLSAEGLKFCIYGASMITLIFSDLEERILPDEFTLGGAAAGVVIAFFAPMGVGLIDLLLHSLDFPRLISAGESLFSAAVSGGLLWVVGAIYEKLRHREGLGLGDVKMVAMIGAFVGLQTTLLVVIAGSLLGSVVGILYIWLAKKDAATYELPFGTFLGVSALIVGFASHVFWHF
jgi:leader peptidase (prepilin peptidase)/N-methyltransferase